MKIKISIPKKVMKELRHYFDYQINALVERDMFPANPTTAQYADENTRAADMRARERLDDAIFNYWKSIRLP